MPSLKGLVLWYTFESNKIENSKVKDRSAWENHAILYGPTEIDGKIEKGLSLDGTDDYLDCGKKPSLDFTTGFSLEIWLKSAGTQSLWARAISRGDYRYELVMGGSNGDRAQFQATISDTLYYTSSVDIPHNTWSHWVGTWKSGEPLKLYLDGELKVQTGSISGTMSSTTKTLEIGRQHTYTGRNFKGTIDEVRLYDRALSAEEVRRHFREKRHVQIREEAENLAGLWIPEISVNTSTLKDLSRWGNHGALTGTNWKQTDLGVWTLELDGIDDYVTFTDHPSLNILDFLTIEAWIKTEKVGRGTVFTRGLPIGADTQAISFCFFVDADYPGKIRLRISNGVKENTVYSTTSVNDGKWHHVATSFNGKTLKIYVDGINEKTESQDIIPQIGNRTYIGRAPQAALKWLFEGFIGKLSLYNRELPPIEIKEHFESQRTQYGV